MESKLGKVIAKIDFFLPNKSEFLELTGSNSLSEGIKNLPSSNNCSTIIKMDEEGAGLLENGSLNMFPAFLNRHPVDIIGAGDSFDAGFIGRFLRGASLPDCVRFGNLTGAVSTTKAGGTAALSSLDEVLRIANDTFATNQFDDMKR